MIPLFVRDKLFVSYTKSEHNITITLTTMTIYVTWASSATRLASRPIRYVIIDEADKIRFPKTSREQAPIELAIARTRTYEKLARIVIVSTPSIRDAPITREMEQCEEIREWQIPCHSCSTYFYPSMDLITWPKRDENENDVEWSYRVQRSNATTLRCPSCNFLHFEHHRQLAVERGRWVYTPKANPIRVGFQINVIGTRWCSLDKIAAKWIRKHTDPVEFQELINQDLGEIYEQKSTVLNSSRLSDFIQPNYKLRAAPDWVGQLIAAADSQLDGWYWTVRGFGKDKRSILIDYGFSPTLDLLRASTLDNTYPLMNAPGRIGISALAVDARGSPGITELILRWSMTDTRIRPIIGIGRVTERGGEPIRELHYQKEINNTWIGGKRYSVDTNYFKDLLVHGISQGRWFLPCDVTQSYLSHFDSESKVKVIRAGQITWLWKKKSERAPNHYWDCEVMTEALAWRFRLELIPDAQTLYNQRQNNFVVQLEDEGRDRWLDISRSA